jgi:hypothetical protein
VENTIGNDLVMVLIAFIFTQFPCKSVANIINLCDLKLLFMT